MVPLSVMVIFVALPIASVFVVGVVLAAAVGAMIVLLLMQLACHFLGRAPLVTITLEVILGWAKIAIIVTLMDAVPSVTTALRVVILGVVISRIVV